MSPGPAGEGGDDGDNPLGGENPDRGLRRGPVKAAGALGGTGGRIGLGRVR